jgi:hypothetical protein
MGFLGALALGMTCHAKAQFGGFFQALLAARRWAHFAGQADFPKSHKIPWAGACRASCFVMANSTARSAAGSLMRTPTHRVDKHVLVHAGHTGMAVQHRQQHGQAIAVQSDRLKRRGLGPPLSTKRLDFHQQGPRALQA